MGRFISFILIVFLTLALPSITYARSFRSSSSDVYVHGYHRKDGTYVQPHYRSAPDGIISNNYSCIDNGKCGLSGASSYVPGVIPTSTPLIIPDNPVAKGNVSFNQMSRKPYYTVHARWFAIGDR